MHKFMHVSNVTDARINRVLSAFESSNVIKRSSLLNIHKFDEFQRNGTRVNDFWILMSVSISGVSKLMHEL